jgi:ADP-ribose pyrophosphatase YjhB (NUDIX family)
MVEEGWIEPNLWKAIEESIPIPCVDILPWRRRADNGAIEIGLIERDSEDSGRSWNLVGGRIRRNESIEAAIERHMRTTLGGDVTWDRCDYSVPDFAGEYFTSPTPGHGYDPRHHAVSFSYAVEIYGPVAASGEAYAIEFFTPDRLPPDSAIGFAQFHAIHALIRRLLGS